MCAAAPPGELEDDCLELASYLIDFETTLCATELSDPDYYPGYAGAASFANGNSGEQLLGPGNWDALLEQLDRLAWMGVSVIRLDITYPLLTPGFHDHLLSLDPNYDKTRDDYLQFFKDTMAEIRARGFTVAIEHSNMIPSIAVNDPSSYYDLIKSLGPAPARARFMQERADEYQLMAVELDPDYLTAVSEIETEHQAFGQIDGEDLFTPMEWRDYVAFAISQLPPHTVKLGAGSGVWESEEYTQLFTPMTELDYVDFHFFPASNVFDSYFDTFLERIDPVRQLDPSKGITVGEAWLYKITGSELITNPPGLPELLSRDCYSYFEPLDQKLIELFSYASRLKQIDILTPIWTKYFFSYLDYADLAPLTPLERIAMCDQAAVDNMQADIMTGTGDLYKNLALETNILVVCELSPDQGPQTGPGTNHMVTISGENFSPTEWTGVSFGTAPAADVQILDTNTLTALVPTGVDVVDVTVLSIRGGIGRQRTKPAAYSYDPPPVVATVEPNSGPETGGRLVVIRGENFLEGSTSFSGATNIAVMFGNIPATEVTVFTSEIIQARPPDGVGLGAVDISVRNPDLQWGVLQNGYTFVPPPLISSLDPDSGPTSGGTLVAITGQNFLPGVPGTRVWFGPEASNVNVISPTLIEAVTAPGGGTVPVVVLNPDGQLHQVDDAFTYVPPPLLVAVVPPQGPEEGGNPVYLGGANFQVGATVMLGSQTALIDSLTANLIQVVAPAGSGQVTVKVTNPDGQQHSWEDLYSYVPAPLISSIVPESGPSSGGTLVTITGQNFVPGSPDTRVWIGPEALNVNVISPTLIEAVTAPGAGTVPVLVLNPDGQRHMVADLFTYVPGPLLLAVVPTQGPEEGGNFVWLGGANFQPGATVMFGTQTAIIDSLTANLIQVVAPAGSGQVAVEVINPDGQQHAWENLYSYTPVP